MIKGSILQEHIMILNVYVPNNRASKYVSQEQMELQGEIDRFTIIVGDVNTLVSEMGKSSMQKICKDIVELNNTRNQLDIIDI